MLSLYCTVLYCTALGVTTKNQQYNPEQKNGRYLKNLILQQVVYDRKSS